MTTIQCVQFLVEADKSFYFEIEAIEINIMTVRKSEKKAKSK